MCLKSVLLRQGYHYKGTADWGDRHLRYLRTLTLPLPAQNAGLENYLLAYGHCAQRVSRLDDLLAAQVPHWRLYPEAKVPMNLRGFQLVATTVLVGESGDIRRFPPRATSWPTSGWPPRAHYRRQLPAGRHYQ